MPEGNTNPEGEGIQRKPIIVTVEQGNNQTADITVSGVNGIFTDIRQYNDQFSMGRMMARSLFNFIKFEDEENDDSQTTEPSIAQEEEHQKMSASALTVIHGEILSRIGLSLEPVAGKHATMYGQGEQAGEGEMRVNIVNRDRFISFLDALNPDQVASSELKPNLESLSGILAQQVLDHYDLGEPNDETLQLFGGLEKIVEQYERLGMNQAVARLEAYLEHAKQGNLREFVSIQRRGLMANPGESFGPGDWQKDADVAVRWNDAFSVLEKVKENPKAEVLYKELLSHLRFCLDYAIQDTDRLTKPGYSTDYIETTKRKFIAIKNRMDNFIE